MVTQGPTTPEIQADPPSRILAAFLEGFGDLIPRFAESMRVLHPDPNDRVVIAAFEAPLVVQVNSLRDYLLSVAAPAAPAVLAEVDLFLERMAATQLTQAARQVATNPATPMARVAFRDLFEIIKKIIKRILKLIGITVAPWIITFLEILDELVDMLSSLGVFGLTRTMNQRHRDTMENLTKLAYLEKAEAALERDDSDV